MAFANISYKPLFHDFTKVRYLKTSDNAALVIYLSQQVV